MDQSDFENRVFEKFDHLDEKMDDLCTRMTRTETKLDSHLEQSEKKAASKKQIVYIALAAVGSYVVSVFQHLSGG